MKINTKPQIVNSKLYSSLLVIILLFCSELSIAQTVSNVFPTRVTKKTVITIVGTGFNETIRDNIDLGTIPIINRTLLSATEMSFEIAEVSTSNVSQNLTVGSISMSSVNNTIQYIAPKVERLSDDNADNTVNRIEEIFTNYNGFWRSEQWRNSADPDSPTNPNMPNTRHELLGFTVGGVTYSTGVDDAVLTANGISFVTQNYKAYASASISGTITESNALMLAEKLDGIEEGNLENNSNISNEIKQMKIYDVFVDGVNGLDIGTGATQFNEAANIQFFSGDGQVGATNDNIPDLLITQIGASNSSKPDVYYYADIDGNVVGTPIELFIRNQNDNNGAGLLARWRIDFFDYRNFADYDVATPFRRVFSSLKTRRLRMVGLELSDFDINASNIGNVNNINSASGGAADIAFLAYNAGAFKIKSPLVTDYPTSRYVCKYPFNSNIDFTVVAEVDGGPSGPGGLPTADEEIQYQWYKNNTEIPGATASTYTLPTVDEADSGLYKVRVSNKFGTSIVPVRIISGGVPSTWNGTAWEQPSSYSAFIVPDNARNLIFPENYTVSSDLEGCDCTVPAGSEVTIASNTTLKLHREITVEPQEADQYDPATNQMFPGLPAGRITLEDNASLIQTMPTTINDNSGPIKMKRIADNLNEFDYVYWSSPVSDYNVSNISNTPTYVWDVNATNPNGSEGNWISAASSIMEAGKGYIVRVPTATAFTTEFVGVPNNGEITINVGKTSNTQAADDSHWNLVGNPYPSAINALSFLNRNTDLDGNVRIWMHNNAISSTPNPVDNPFYNNFTYNYGDQYVTYNGTGSTPANVFNGDIAAGQGFFVQLLDSSPSGPITFNNNMRFDSSENAYDNSEFYRANNPSTETEVEKQLLWLSLIQENGRSASTLIGYVDGATNQRDRLYDALGESTDFGVYSLINDEEMIIQGRSLPFKDSDIVPLGIKTQENGIYTIGINQLKGSHFINDEQEIYIEDRYLNIIHNLRAQPYSFTATEGVTNDRFVVRYTNSTLSIDDVSAGDTLVYVKNETLNIKSQNHNIEGVTVYNLTGKQIVDYKIKNSYQDFSEPFVFSKGVYLVTITLDEGRITTKKVIN